MGRPVEDWGKLLGDSAAVTAMLARLLHHGHILKCGPRSWWANRAACSRAQRRPGLMPRRHLQFGIELG